MSRSLQDQFIDDDEEEACPLCVEELDLTDKGFRPCPCGYQVCQFCYHNVKTNMNGLCPACRRPYSEKDIDYNPPTEEEKAAHKIRQATKLKKSQAALQKEKQRAEADHLSRKHLAGLRVVQKNLVYVTGLEPTTHEEQLLQTLRGDEYFGQYGRIVKIVVSKAKDRIHPDSVGVYVTYEHKEDAESCIRAVNGSKNGDRTLRAQFGTTKYCSAYLRGEQCQNRQCMFLHEPGEANESYSRADLSALNAGSSQRDEGGKPPPPQSQQPVAASQPMTRQGSDQPPQSPAPERPALPSTASWASRPLQQSSRPESRATSVSVDQAPRTVTPAPAQPEQAPSQAPPPVSESATVAQAVPKQPRIRIAKPAAPLQQMLKNFSPNDFKFTFSLSSLPPAEAEIIKNYPPLFDDNGGAKRRIRRQREEEQRRMEQEAQQFQQPPAVEQEDNPEMSGSLQLGGEPEERQPPSQASAIRPPPHEGILDSRFQLEGVSSPAGISERGLTPQQHQQLLLQTMKSPNEQAAFLNQQASFQQPVNPPGHQRNTSRFSFANDTASASTSVKPVANQKLMNQQSAMMPQQGGFGGQQSQQFYTSNVQGPPPGLKTTGTPPVSGGMTFGQGHGFATGGLAFGAQAANRNNAQEEMMRNLLRGRESGSIGGGMDVKHDAEYPSLPPSRQASINLDDGSRLSTPPVPPGFEAQLASESRRSTPTVPPGLSKPSALPHLGDDGPGSRPMSRSSSRASLRRQVSHPVIPALPLRPGTPARSATPSRQASEVRETKAEWPAEETPTKQSKSVGKQPEAAPAAEKLATSSKENAAPTAVPNAKAASKEEEKASVPVTPAKKGGVPKSEVESAAAAEATKAPEAQKHARKPSAPLGFQPSAKGQATVQASEMKAAPVQTKKAESQKEDAQRRKHPGKLDITAAVDKRDEANAAAASRIASAEAAGTPSKAAQRSISQTPSKVESPGVIASPSIRNAPKTLRVVQTPKGETPPATSSPAPSLPNPPVSKLPSRQPSVASFNLPGTPSSEQVSISDNISVTSTSQSRPTTPPPPGAGKVGTAPVRTKTKSQVKKERQERAKQLEEEKVKLEAEPIAEEPVQEAIVSRKKKTKKEKEPKSRPAKAAPTDTGDSTPTASQPASPGPKVVAETSSKIPPPKPSTPVKTPTQPPMPSPHELSPPPTPTLTAAQIMQELKAQGPEIQKCIDSLFRTPNSAHFKPGQNISPKDLQSTASWKPDFKMNLTKDEVDALLKGTMSAVHYGGEGGRMWDRGIVTPSGAHLRALTEELESRFLDLEKALQEMPDELRFRPSKPQNETQFPYIDLEAARRQHENAGGRGVSVMEAMVQDGSTMKKGAFLVDEASKYINEFVMPPVTPPPSAGGAVAGARAGGQAGAGAAQVSETLGQAVSSPEITERQLHEAKRVAEEKENALKKVLKKNRKLLGLG